MPPVLIRYMKSHFPHLIGFNDTTLTCSTAPGVSFCCMNSDYSVSGFRARGCQAAVWPLQALELDVVPLLRRASESGATEVPAGQHQELAGKLCPVVWILCAVSVAPSVLLSQCWCWRRRCRLANGRAMQVQVRSSRKNITHGC